MNDIPFYTLDGEGHEVDVKILHMSDIKACPSFILLPEHYRPDGSCRHDEPNCENDGCLNLKYQDEIYCMTHLQSLFGLTAEDFEDE